MVYKKGTSIAICIAIAMAFISEVTFAATDIVTNDKIIDGTLQMLMFLQKYSWPVLTLFFVFALYKFYVVGSEKLEEKVTGQRMIIGIAVFMVILQCLPLFYAFVIVS
ncbi:MAG: hypothetical protein RSB67_02415 [Clostridia bacterium]